MESKSRLTLLALCFTIFAINASAVKLVPRQLTLLPPPTRPTEPTPPADPPTPSPPTPSPPTPPISTPSSSSSSTTEPPSSTPSSSSTATSTTPTSTTLPPVVTPPPVTTESVGTDAQGLETTVTNVVTPPPITPAPAEETQAPPPKSSPGLSIGSIVGLSVAGGVAVLGIIGFFVWKFTRKRRFDDFNDSEAIKWPELNAHSGNDQHALPTKNTGRAGFETSPTDLSRAPSLTSNTHGASSASAYSAPYSMAAASASDVYGDPYNVPPLPHQNPNIPPMPYRDDPNAAAAGAFYDPYSGPVPHTIYDPEGPPSATLAASGGAWGGEAIPMTQMAQRTRSPGPAMVYDAGRGSPAPAAGRRSPGPGMAYETGRASPGPAGRRSPGPAAAYGADPYGRRSPGPGQAYDGYGAR
ncbi:hypothetical protein HGRIS_004476 [Hohenbuehelia grisea]|uniref:Uncharacterized protein n=1 Tax=Hohenbuehelia grisea TaxID=104357 RepID=A0ABR3JC19_9AGAR